MNKTFDRIVCITLERSKDRKADFIKDIPTDWPFREIEIVNGIDGEHCLAPNWWGGKSNGAWGCYRSHLREIERALNDSINSLLLFEDDAIFCEDFTKKCLTFLEHVPKDWGMIYLGGEHLRTKIKTPIKVNEHVYQAFNINRTHAFALNKPTMYDVYKHLHSNDWQRGHHIDHHLGRFHENHNNIYVPNEWLVGQRAVLSTVANRQKPKSFWVNADDLELDNKMKENPFIVVLGLHSSGSSLLAGVLYKLGCYLGKDENLIGYYGKNPKSGKCGYEDRKLMNLCESCIPFPSVDYAMEQGQRWTLLRKWIRQHQIEAVEEAKVPAAKYPQLCRFGPQLKNILPHGLQIICCNRPIEDSIKSIQKRCPNKNPEALAQHQRWLMEGRNNLLKTFSPEKILNVDYYELLEDPYKVIGKIAGFLPQVIDIEAIHEAVKIVNPDKCHIKS